MRRHGPLPLFEWQPPPARTLRRRRRSVLGLVGLGLALLGLGAMLDPEPRLIWNASASAPVGLWRIHPHLPARVGDMVLVRTPANVRRLAAERHYLPDNVPLLKRVEATDGDVVCALGREIFVNGRRIAGRLFHDRHHRPLPWWTGCRKLDQGTVFLLIDEVPDSFDGRYFGPVKASAIIGRATPLWRE